ncbi:CLOCK-interacting pacemaker a [Archocentrus centrarchus]|uniref:CLOCK-interacting pacemaker a n=1 Tax=Archocentrus centrarchus TaxID=63155 RepID=UPI0011E9EAA9|nr:CLOCK-interacting pacemaker-like [Archocentrus centrarchus]
MNRFNQPSSHRTPLFTRTSHLGISKHDLERDSGFSDASSEYHSTVEVTDSEDAARNGSIVSQEQTGPQVAVMGGSYTGLSPMIIMNNFVLKQPSSLAPTEKQWSFPSPLEIMPQSQVVLLQPMVSNDNSSSLKTGSENMRQSKSYMPILKSYPRIAPHPVDTPTKRAGSSRVRGSATAAYDQRQRRHHHGHRVYSSPSPLSSLQMTAQTTSNFEAPTNQTQAAEHQEQLSNTTFSSQVETSSVPSYIDEFRTVTEDNGMLADEYQDEHSLRSNKLKRFSNTYNILNKSGLLGITMRTKQLIKENKRTQGELQQLQEQTTLLLEALNSGNPQLWTKLQLSLQDTEKEQWGAKAQSVLA